LWAPIFTLSVVLFFAWTLWEGREWWFRARLFPWTIGFAGLVLALVQLYLDVKYLVKTKDVRRPDAPEPESSLALRRTLAITGWILGFFAAIWLLGFPIAVPLATFLYLKAGAPERWPIAVALTLFAWIAFYGLFDYALHVPFPPGLLLDWLEI
jgi:hypothetical protein